MVQIHCASTGIVPESTFDVSDCEIVPPPLSVAVISVGSTVVVPFVIRFVKRNVTLPDAELPSAFWKVPVIVATLKLT